MEVHAHTHTPRKKWTHYFWEFLMLFLAVFCGFLAEYQLEHKIEKDREKQYSKTLYEDLKADTAILNGMIKETNFVIPKVDSFRYLVHTKAIDDIPSGTWYYYGRFGTRNIAASLQNATLQQLVSSGGLRYDWCEPLLPSRAQKWGYGQLPIGEFYRYCYQYRVPHCPNRPSKLL